MSKFLNICNSVKCNYSDFADNFIYIFNKIILFVKINKINMDLNIIMCII